MMYSKCNDQISALKKILQTNVIDENIKKSYEVDDTIFVKTDKN